MKFSPTAVSCCLAIMAVYAMPAFSAELEGGKKLRGLSSNGNGNGNGNDGNNCGHGKPTVLITDGLPDKDQESGGERHNNDMIDNNLFDQCVLIKFLPGKKEDVKYGQCKVPSRI